MIYTSADESASSHRRTKIVATLGPASNTEGKIRELIHTGANVFRLNFSHGSHEQHLDSLNKIRTVSEELGVPVAVLQDLSGPKIRISDTQEAHVTLLDGQEVTLHVSNGEISTTTDIYVALVAPGKAMKIGHRALLADGIIEIRAIEVKGDAVKCTVVKGGRIRSRVGIAFPDSDIDIPSTTEKDMRDLAWGMEHKVDYVAISFVRNAEDVIKLRESMEEQGADLRIIAKIERKIALENIDEIVDVSDGLMVARGDLGLEVPLEKLPRLQRELIKRANDRGIPVIVATQMLHSMITSVRPTRAEVSDIASAVMSGTDAVMLSEETAIGEHPVLAVDYIGKIAQETEKSLVKESYRLGLKDKDLDTVPDAVAYAACGAADKVDAQALIACTETGNTARLISKYRPQQPLYGVSTTDAALQRMCLYWGVIPVSCKSTSSHIDEVDVSIKAVEDHAKFPKGSLAVVTGGLSVRTPGATSVMEIKQLGHNG